jgi:hypothetical protein
VTVAVLRTIAFSFSAAREDRSGQVVRGDQLHAGQHQQHDDERVPERVRELQCPVRRLLVDGLVDAVAVEPVLDLLLVEA